jgi:HEAT repeat protein
VFKQISMAALLMAATLMIPGTLHAQRQPFLPVEGTSFTTKLEHAIRLGRMKQTRFWTAYSFDVRPGVAVDVEYRSRGGTTIVDGTSLAVGSKIETRNLGIFVLHEPTGDSIASVEVYNLDRPREYSGYPVFWLGRAGNQETLNYLKGIVEANQIGDLRRRSIVAIALHDDPSVGGLLEDFSRRSYSEDVRSTAVFWLGQIPGYSAFLADLVRNEQESTKVRKEAAIAIAVGKDRGRLSALESAYGAITNRAIKKQIIFAASMNNNDEGSASNVDDQGISFLIRVAETEQDRELRKQSLFWLGQKAGNRTLEVLSSVIEKPNDDIEVQKHVVFAISQRRKDEAVPLLIKIAKTHPRAEVRKQAIFWLGQTGDARALELFKEILSN